MSNESRYHAPMLREIRIKKTWSQGELAKRAGVSPSTIIRLEKRGGVANELTLFKIAKALEVMVDDLTDERLGRRTADGRYILIDGE